MSVMSAFEKAKSEHHSVVCFSFWGVWLSGIDRRWMCDIFHVQCAVLLLRMRMSDDRVDGWIDGPKIKIPLFACSVF